MLTFAIKNIKKNRNREFIIVTDSGCICYHFQFNFSPKRREVNIQSVLCEICPFFTKEFGSQNSRCHCRMYLLKWLPMIHVPCPFHGGSKVSHRSFTCNHYSGFKILAYCITPRYEWSQNDLRKQTVKYDRN